MAESPGSSIPPLLDFVRAYRVIRSQLTPTPVIQVRVPSTAGQNIFTKLDNLNVTGSFKVRGALYRLSLLGEAHRKRGVVTCSTGNHGLAVAYAAREYGSRATIVLPRGVSGRKVDLLGTSGADLRVVPGSLTVAEGEARRIAVEEGLELIEDGNDRALLVGAGSVALEMIWALPELEVLLIPVGGGNLIAGIAACAKQLNPAIEVIGVQSSAAPAVHESWRRRTPVTVPATTAAGGLGGERPGDLAFGLILQLVDDIVLVSDEELFAALGLAATHLGQLLEPSGAAWLAALARFPERWGGCTVLGLSTGGNADTAEISRGLSQRDN
ncbi:MAG TPA: pyridoxal-phosphate dependent enzyme [Candidatus Acidoferrales bacterium]|nr:pyridoxal-phosphate dependent enzyme [Candidatus Acidoferrales bacterium]